MSSSAPVSLSVIVHLRSPDRSYIDRLALPTLDAELPGNVEVIIADDGSPHSLVPEIEQACKRLGYRHLRLDTVDQRFSQGRARNQGARHARGHYLMFLDVDLMPYPGFYRDALAAISTRTSPGMKTTCWSCQWST